MPDTAYRGPSQYGLGLGPKTAAPTELNAVASPAAGAAAAGSLVSLHNPLTWFAVLAAVTLGLASVSTAVKAGPIKVAVGAGK